jgi:saccharopine dehydrogenase-like NADP-dependent oxidoreductase
MTRLITLVVVVASYQLISSGGGGGGGGGSGTRSSFFCHALNVLVVGGSGRVGGSTVRWLRKLSERRGIYSPISISVGGRRRESYEAAMRKGVIPPSGVPFVPLDVDGDASALADALRRWKDAPTATATDDDEEDGARLVVHTAGPFQGRRVPTLLSSCIDLGIPYVDVCDEWELAETSRVELHARAKDAGVPCIVSCGIWPGVSALMAAEGVSRLVEKLGGGGGGVVDDDVVVESVDYSFFTAGTGNAGPTIVSATFLLLATEAITYLDGRRADVEPWTRRRDVDFGGGVGVRPVWLLDNPDVPTTALYLDVGMGKKEGGVAAVRSCSSRFGTAPLFWNYLFGAMKALPRSLLYDRDAMQGFSLFSEPIIRLVDMLVGSTNAMRVDITARTKGGGGEGRREQMTLRMAHPDLESCVGLATAAFALEVADSVGIVDEDGGEGGATIEPGVWFPVELGKRARTNILRVAKEDAFVYELGESFT